MIVLQSSSFPGRVKKRETARDRPNLSCRNMPRRPVLCLGVAVALFTAKILCFVQTANFQPKRPDRRHHVCMSANEFVNMAQTILGVTTFDENVTKVALAIMEKEKEKEKAIMEKEMQKGMALKEMEMENSAAVRYRHLQYKYLSVSSRFWLEQLSQTSKSLPRADSRGKPSEV